MLLSALIIGYGSIGKRHAEILDSMDIIRDVNILSSQKNLPYNNIKSLSEIVRLDPNYIIIASNTALHYEHLFFLETALSGKKILVEKPLFNSFHDFIIKKNDVFVGYNLRYHPLLLLMKEKILEKKIWNINVFCGSYLPDWRPNRNYSDTYSAKKLSGGGVLLDLSHELDYIKWLIGDIYIDYVKSEKISDLKIETDDYLLLSGQSESGIQINISLNYFTKEPIRQIIIDGEGVSIQADLISNKFNIYEGNNFNDYSLSSFNKNSTYVNQHRSILQNDDSITCSYTEGLETLRLIEKIKTFNSK